MIKYIIYRKSNTTTTIRDTYIYRNWHQKPIKERKKIREKPLAGNHHETKPLNNIQSKR
jgi:hypothetical protein